MSSAFFEEVHDKVESQEKEEDLYEQEAVIKGKGSRWFEFQVLVVREKADQHDEEDCCSCKKVDTIFESFLIVRISSILLADWKQLVSTCLDQKNHPGHRRQDQQRKQNNF